MAKLKDEVAEIIGRAMDGQCFADTAARLVIDLILAKFESDEVVDAMREELFLAEYDAETAICGLEHAIKEATKAVRD